MSDKPEELSRRRFFTRTVTAAGATLLVPVWLGGCDLVKDTLGLAGEGDGKGKKKDEGEIDEGSGDEGGDGAKAKGDGKGKDKAKGADGAKDDKAAAEADVGFLNKGVLMEQSALMTYETAAALPFIKKDKDIMAVAGLFMSQHEAHRDALLKMIEELGGKAVDFKAEAKLPEIPKDVTNEKLKKAARKIAVLKFARSRELDAATNYFKAATEILQTAPARKLAANILPVEAQHVAVYDMVLGAEKPVNAPLFMDEV